MITYVNTDIFESNANALVVPVNTFGVMGKGLALEFKKRFPVQAEEYRRWCVSHYGIRPPWKDSPLYVRQIKRSSAPILIFFPTKEDWRYPSRLDLIEHGLNAFAVENDVRPEGFEIASVAFPKLGCGLGGLDWECQVKPLMERYLNPLPISVSIHLFP
jgi:O-acetyl-ADP-ribose deacetylase (regulator of RNase III)